MKIFSAAQIRQWDAYTIANEPVSSIDLMERAAGACFNWITPNINQSKLFIFFCGPGNNGGDGLAIARMVHLAGYEVSVYLLGVGKRSEDFKTNLERITQLVTCKEIITATDFPEIQTNAIIIDALFGSGLSRPLDGVAAALVNYINESQKLVISIDIPSGLFVDAHAG
ncbi:MAG: carbohydrate kinase, partial [Ferruginibacter sp.]|nr:carbohydrate kinase [Ferruginibacter sp.]